MNTVVMNVRYLISKISRQTAAYIAPRYLAQINKISIWSIYLVRCRFPLYLPKEADV
jgi:hypothetical protein